MDRKRRGSVPPVSQNRAGSRLRHGNRGDQLKGLKPAIPLLTSGVVFLAVGVAAAAAWRNFLPLGMGALCLAIGVVSLVRQKRTGGSKSVAAEDEM